MLDNTMDLLHFI